MAYFPPTNSVVAFQSDSNNLVAKVSVVSHSPQSVAALQGTNPWNISNSSVQVVGQVPPASVSGVGTFNINPIGSGSIISKLTNSSVTTLQGTNPWAVQLTSGSIATTVGNSSVQLVGGTVMIGSVAAYQGTKPWAVELTSGSIATTVGNSSVQVVGIQPPHSVATLQGTNPWFVQPTSGSVIAFQLAGSVMAVDATVNTGNSSVQLLGGNVAIGSVTALQGTNPWRMTGSVQGTISVLGTVPVTQTTNPWIITGSIQGGGAGTQYAEDTLVTSVTGTAVMFRRSQTSSLMAVVNPANPLPVVGSISGTVSTNPSSVQVLGGIAVLGSIATLQGTNPWTVGPSSVQLISTSASIATQVNRILTGVSSVQLMSGINNAGSITAIQGTNPWVVGNSSVQVVGAMPAQSVSGVGLFNVNHTGNGSVITVAQGSVASTVINTPQVSVHGFIGITPASIVSGTGSVNGAASVAVIAAPGAGLRNYITDVIISNTGAATTLVNITDGDASIIGRTIAPAGGGSNIISLATPMVPSLNKPVNVAAVTATSTLHAWFGGYKAP